MVVSESYQFFESLYFIDSIREYYGWVLHYVFVYISLSQCCQVIFHAILCSREVLTWVNLCNVMNLFILVLVHAHLIHHFTSFYYWFHVDDVGYIMALLGRFYSYRLHHMIQKLDLGTIKYLGTCMRQWRVSSISTVGLHHWPLIEWFLECSTTIYSHSLECTRIPWESFT